MNAPSEPPGGDAGDAVLHMALELLGACMSNSILMAPIWCGKKSPQAEQYSFGIIRKILLNVLFSVVKPGHEMRVLEEFFAKTKAAAEEWRLLVSEPAGNA